MTLALRASVSASVSALYSNFTLFLCVSGCPVTIDGSESERQRSVPTPPMSALDLPADCFPSSVHLFFPSSRRPSFHKHTKTLAPTVHFHRITLPPALTSPAEAVIFSRRRAFVCGNVGVRLQRGELANIHYRGEKHRDSGG